MSTHQICHTINDRLMGESGETSWIRNQTARQRLKALCVERVSANTGFHTHFIPQWAQWFVSCCPAWKKSSWTFVVAASVPWPCVCMLELLQERLTKPLESSVCDEKTFYMRVQSQPGVQLQRAAAWSHWQSERLCCKEEMLISLKWTVTGSPWLL